MLTYSSFLSVWVQKMNEKGKEKRHRRRYSSLNVSFELEYPLTAYFKELVELIENAFSDDLPLEIHADKLVIKGMDDSRVKMFNLVFPKHIFEEWLVSNGKERMAELPLRITVPIKEVKYAIEDAGKDAKIRFDINVMLTSTVETREVEVRNPEKCPKCGRYTNYNRLPPDKRHTKKYKNGRGMRESYKCECGWRGKVSIRKVKRKVHLTEVDTAKTTFEITVKEKTIDKFKVKYVEINEEETPLPKLLFDAKFKVMAKEFHGKIKKLLKHHYDSVQFLASDEKLTLTAIGDVTNVKTEITRQSDIIIDADCPSSEVKSRFTLYHLISLIPKRLVDVITLEYSTDMPLRITWFLPKIVTAEFYLAPLITYE